MDASTGDLFGHIVAGRPGSHQAYVIPGYKVMADIARATGVTPLIDSPQNQRTEIARHLPDEKSSGMLYDGVNMWRQTSPKCQLQTTETYLAQDLSLEYSLESNYIDSWRKTSRNNSLLTLQALTVWFLVLLFCIHIWYTTGWSSTRASILIEDSGYPTISISHILPCGDPAWDPNPENWFDASVDYQLDIWWANTSDSSGSLCFAEWLAESFGNLSHSQECGIDRLCNPPDCLGKQAI